VIKLKSLLTEGREKSNCWISPFGRIIPVTDTHATMAGKILPSDKDPIMELWKKGYLRVTWMYDGALVAHNEVRPPNEKQVAVLKDIALEGEHSKVEFDSGGDKPRILWSEFDILQEILADIPDYAKRVEAGRKIENNIINSLRQMGYTIEDPTEHEDKIQKIDGWWIGERYERYPIQIKFRESGDDILLEMMRNIDRNVLGRDMKGESSLYIVANRKGETKMFLTDDIKKFAKKIMNDVFEDLKTRPGRSFWEGPGWQVRIQCYKHSGERKLMGYFSPDLFKKINSWNLNIF
jgi:hypothetical protein